MLLSPVVVLLGFGWLALGRGVRPMVPLEGPGARAPWLPGALQGVGVAGLLVAGLWVSSGHLLASYHLGGGLALASRAGPQRVDTLRLAVARYSAGLAYGWDRSELLLHRAMALRELDRPEQARQDMEASFRQLPSPGRALFLGDLALGRRRVEEAASWYRLAVRLHPRYARGYNNLGVAHLRAGRVVQACRFLRRALSLRPSDHAIRANWTRHCPKKAAFTPHRAPTSEVAPTVQRVH